MEYSWSLGEMTEGLSWAEEPFSEKGAGCGGGGMSDGRRRATVAAMLLAVLASYLTGETVLRTAPVETDREYGDAISVMSPSVETVTEEIWASEREARIEELATAYIEEYMSKNCK